MTADTPTPQAAAPSLAEIDARLSLSRWAFYPEVEANDFREIASTLRAEVSRLTDALAAETEARKKAEAERDALFARPSDIRPRTWKWWCVNFPKIVARATAAEAALAIGNQNRRATFEAMVAMRNAINEHTPMPSLESDLLQGPEDSVFCATVAEAVVAALAEREISDLQIEAFDRAYNLKFRQMSAAPGQPQRALIRRESIKAAIRAALAPDAEKGDRDA